MCDFDNHLLIFWHIVRKKCVDLLIRDCKADWHPSLNQFQTKNSIGEFFFVLICWLEKLALAKVKGLCKMLLICWLARLSRFSKAKNFNRWIFFALICWLEKLDLAKVKCMCKKLLICWLARLSKFSKAKNFNRWIFFCVDLLIRETSPS